MSIPKVKERKITAELQLAKDLLEFTSTYLCGSYASSDEAVHDIVTQIDEFLYGGDKN